MEEFEKSFKEMCTLTQKIASRSGDDSLTFANCAANMLVIYNKSQNPPFFARLFRKLYQEHKFNFLSPLYDGESSNPNVKWLKDAGRKSGKKHSDMDMEYDGVAVFFQKGNPKHQMRCFQFTAIFNAASKYYSILRDADKVVDLPFQFLRVLYECVYYAISLPTDPDEPEITSHEKETLRSTISDIKEQIDCINVVSTGSASTSTASEGIMGRVFSGVKSFFDPKTFNKDSVTSLIQNFAPKDVADSVGNVIGAAQKAMSDSKGNILEAFGKIKDDPSVKETVSSMKNAAEKKFEELAGGLGGMFGVNIPTIDTTGGEGSVDASLQE